jgi:hypothetical protein
MSADAQFGSVDRTECCRTSRSSRCKELDPLFPSTFLGLAFPPETVDSSPTLFQAPMYFHPYPLSPSLSPTAHALSHTTVVANRPRFHELFDQSRPSDLAFLFRFQPYTMPFPSSLSLRASCKALAGRSSPELRNGGGRDDQVARPDEICIVTRGTRQSSAGCTHRLNEKDERIISFRMGLRRNRAFA